MSRKDEWWESGLRIEVIYADEARGRVVGWGVYRTEHDGQWALWEAASYEDTVRHDVAIGELASVVGELLEYL